MEARGWVLLGMCIGAMGYGAIQAILHGNTILQAAAVIVLLIISAFLLLLIAP